MPRKSKTAEEIGYARSAWEERLDLEDEFKGVVVMYLHPEHRIGVWKVRLVFTKLKEGEQNHLATAAIAYVWPNAYEQSFVGALWAHLIKLRAMLEEQTGLIKSAPSK